MLQNWQCLNLNPGLANSQGMLDKCAAVIRATVLITSDYLVSREEFMTGKVTWEGLESSWPWAATTTAWSYCRLPQRRPVFPGTLLSDSNYQWKPDCWLTPISLGMQNSLVISHCGTWETSLGWVLSSVDESLRIRCRPAPMRLREREKAVPGHLEGPLYTGPGPKFPQGQML